eukprot:365519-Chlamydomonas_euryale.AAC.2
MHTSLRCGYQKINSKPALEPGLDVHTPHACGTHCEHLQGIQLQDFVRLLSRCNNWIGGGHAAATGPTPERASAMTRRRRPRLPALLPCAHLPNIPTAKRRLPLPACMCPVRVQKHATCQPSLSMRPCMPAPIHATDHASLSMRPCTPVPMHATCRPSLSMRPCTPVPMHATCHPSLSMRPCTPVSEAAHDSWLYAVYFDAGSSGTRVHVYSYTAARWPEYARLSLPGASRKQEPGLSSFAMEPWAAGASLDGLLEFAREQVGGVPVGWWAVFRWVVNEAGGKQVGGERVVWVVLEVSGGWIDGWMDGCVPFAAVHCQA